VLKFPGNFFQKRADEHSGRAFEMHPINSLMSKQILDRKKAILNMPLSIERRISKEKWNVSQTD